MLLISQEPDRKPERKAQTGLEIMVFFIFIMLIFSVAYGLVASKTIFAINADAHEDALQIAEQIASEINTAIEEGNGYSKTIRLRENIQSANYTVYVEKGLVFVDWSKESVASYTIADNVTGNFTRGWNAIENKGGIIFVSQTSG